MSSQNKTLREQEQERIWKQMQAMRAREQQMQQIVLHDQRSQGKILISPKKNKKFKIKNFFKRFSKPITNLNK